MRSLNKNLTGHISSVSVWLACMMAVVSMKPWFAWDFPFDTLLSILFIVCRLPLLQKNNTIRNLLLVEGFLVFSAFYMQLFQIPIKISAIRVIVTVVPISLFLLTTAAEKRLFVNRLIKIYSLILLVSLIGFTLKTVGVELPYSILNNPNPFYSAYKNYYFFTGYQDLDLFTRFTGIFAEPGHVGMISAILLYVNGFSLKRASNVIMTIALIWSFSLAGFLIYAIGLTIYLILKSNYPIRVLMKVMLGFGCIVGVAIATYSPSNDDIVTQLILKRLEFDSSKGLAGNNRNTGNFDNIYSNFMQNHKVVIGMGSEEYGRKFYGTANSSYKTFIMEYGWGATVMLLLFMLLCLIVFPSRIGFGLFCLIVISFIQRPYFLWFIECFAYIVAISEFYIGRQTNNQSISENQAVIYSS